MAQDLDEHVARSACYKLLSLVFLPPRTVGGEELFAGIEKIISMLPSEHQALLKPIVETAPIPRGGPSEHEHTRLFGVGLAATPYGSEYDPLAEARKGHCLADLLGFYEAFGFKLAGRQKEFPDHIAIELEFLSLLLLKSCYARAEGQEEARAICEEAAGKFLADHLGAWGGAFADRVEATTEDDFYRFSARLFRGFILAECHTLRVEPFFMAAAQPQKLEPPACPFASECSEAATQIWSAPKNFC